MNARSSPDEMRHEEIARLTRERFNAQRAAILAGDKPTAKAVREMVMDYVELASLEGAMLDRPNSTSQAFSLLVRQVMGNAAEVEAIKRVERMEREAKDDPDNCWPMTSAMMRRLGLTGN
jgi:hypothetical protein